MKTVMMKNITIKSNPINTKEENILRRRDFTLEMEIASLKKVMDMFLILTKKNSSSWPWIQSLLIQKMNQSKRKIKLRKRRHLMGK
jgi:D-alanyl-D-alanine carboxypeptidase